MGKGIAQWIKIRRKGGEAEQEKRGRGAIFHSLKREICETGQAREREAKGRRKCSREKAFPNSLDRCLFHLIALRFIRLSWQRTGYLSQGRGKLLCFFTLLHCGIHATSRCRDGGSAGRQTRVRFESATDFSANLPPYVSRIIYQCPEVVASFLCSGGRVRE